MMRNPDDQCSQGTRNAAWQVAEHQQGRIESGDVSRPHGVACAVPQAPDPTSLRLTTRPIAAERVRALKRRDSGGTCTKPAASGHPLLSRNFSNAQ